MKKKKTIAKYSPKPICTTRIRLTPDLEDLTELLAKNAHDVWAQQRLSHGWSHGPNRDDTNRKHPCLVPYDELPEVEKEYDRKVAIQSIKAVIALGYPNQFFASLTNCVIANVTTTAGGNYSGAYNGTYGLNWSPPGAINALQPPFQSKGAGSYYLASGCGFFNQGTTNIDSLLLTDLRNKTTYPPFVLTTSFTGNTILSPAVPRDTNGPPDLGYHYDPLDYCWCGLSAGTTLTLTNGVAVGIYGSCGLSVGNKLISQGTPNNHIQLVYYSLVQEQPTPWGANASGNLFSSLNQAQLRFTDLCLAAGQTWNFSPNMDGGGISLVDCQLQAALFNMVGMNWGGMAFTNNIFDRCNLNFADVASGYSLGFYNNLFFGGTLSLNFSNPNWNVYDNLFSSANFHIGNYAPNHGYNGYYNSAIPYDPNTGYTYYVSVDGKFSFLESAHQDSLRLKWFTEYSWPISRLDTNAAYQLATQWLADVSMDVQGLNRDCNLHIRPTAVRGEGATARFLPLYWVYWTKGTEGQGSMASVGLFLPTKTLLQLRVENTQYILRKPLQFTNLDLLLSPSKKQ